MGGGDEIDIVTAGILEVQHDICQRFGRYFSSLACMADIVVLTEQTEQTAMGKKNGAGPISTDQGRFFPKVSVITGYDRFFTGFA